MLCSDNCEAIRQADHGTRNSHHNQNRVALAEPGKPCMAYVALNSLAIARSELTALSADA